MKKLFRISIAAGFVFLLFQNMAGAQTMQDRLVSSTFKTLAKTYITASDFKALKDNTVKRLQALDTDSFHARYPRMLQLVADAPVLTKEFGLKADMPVNQAIAFVRSLDKKKTCSVIDMIPDQIVAQHVMRFMSGKTGSVNSENISSQVTAVWQDLQQRLDKTAISQPEK
jgi:hypothetical protein